MRSSVATKVDQRLYWTVFLLGLVIGLLMAFNSQIGGDQHIMLSLGWQLTHDNVWLQYGMPTSAGGRSPGGFTSLLVALPLYVWNDYRAQSLFLLLTHAAAYLLLLHLLKPALSRIGQWLLLLLVWLAPWHLYFAAHIWNANYMFVFAVLHLASTQRMAKYREAWSTAAHAVLIALAMQVHTSAAVLAIFSILLFLRGHLKIHWGGFVIGMLLGIACYVPWLLAIHNDPTLTPGSKGFFMRGLIYVFPFIRGLMYWLKVSSLSVASRIMDLDFTPTLGAPINVWLTPVVVAIGTLAHLSLIAPIWANWRFFRTARHLLRWQPHDPTTPRAWLRDYITLMFAAALISFAISPTTIMFWQAFIMLPCAALILIMKTEALLKTSKRHLAITSIKVWSCITVIMLVAQALAAPIYRCGGMPSILQSTDRLFQDLNGPAKCLQPLPPQ
jgi:hypothetical protein